MTGNVVLGYTYQHIQFSREQKSTGSWSEGLLLIFWKNISTAKNWHDPGYQLGKMHYDNSNGKVHEFSMFGRSRYKNKGY